jgi:hypothetical protein
VLKKKDQIDVLVRKEMDVLHGQLILRGFFFVKQNSSF